MNVERGGPCKKAVTLLMSIGMMPFVTSLGGCGEMLDDQAETDVETEVGAIGQTTCATTAANAQFTGGAVPAWVSTQTYGSRACTRAAIVDINNHSSTYLGPGDVPGGTWIEWADAAPTTSAACTSAYVRSDLYVRQGDSWVFAATQTGTNLWILNSCSVGSINWGSGSVQAGQSIRIVSQALTSSTATGFRRKLRVESRPPVIIR